NCAEGTTVTVNDQPLVPGTLVPNQPFDLTWDAHACRPFGPHGPRLEGAVRLMVFREDWGWSAIVEPAGLRMAMYDRTIPVMRGSCSVPQWAWRQAPAGYQGCADGTRSRDGR